MNDAREHILKVSFKLFLQKNFKEVTMQDIVTETGLSKGAFYHYFKSKEQLFLEVVESYYLSDEINNYQLLNKSSLKKFYSSYVNKYLKQFIEYIKQAVQLEDNELGANISYYTLIFDALNRFPNFKEKTIESHNKELKMWQDVIDAAILSGEIKPIMKSKYIARMFLYSIDSSFIHFIMEGKFEDSLREIQALWDNFYKEIKK
jgi:TetR/AcrR family transcriptional regulator, transcriptional repressor for nem operon